MVSDDALRLVSDLVSRDSHLLCLKFEIGSSIYLVNCMVHHGCCRWIERDQDSVCVRNLLIRVGREILRVSSEQLRVIGLLLTATVVGGALELLGNFIDSGHCLQV